MEVGNVVSRGRGPTAGAMYGTKALTHARAKTPQKARRQGTWAIGRYFLKKTIANRTAQEEAAAQGAPAVLILTGI